MQYTSPVHTSPIRIECLPYTPTDCAALRRLMMTWTAVRQQCRLTRNEICGASSARVFIRVCG